ATVDPKSGGHSLGGAAGPVTARQLATLMVGSELPTPPPRESAVGDKAVLQVAGLTVRAEDGRLLLDDVSFTIHEGEGSGIAGGEGKGRAELVESIRGIRSSTGSVSLAGESASGWTPRRRREAGVGYIPEDRQRQGLLLDASLWENRILGHQTQP